MARPIFSKSILTKLLLEIGVTDTTSIHQMSEALEGVAERTKLIWTDKDCAPKKSEELQKIHQFESAISSALKAYESLSPSSKRYIELSMIRIGVFNSFIDPLQINLNNEPNEIFERLHTFVANYEAIRATYPDKRKSHAKTYFFESICLIYKNIAQQPLARSYDTQRNRVTGPLVRFSALAWNALTIEAMTEKQVGDFLKNHIFR